MILFYPGEGESNWKTKKGNQFKFFPLQNQPQRKSSSPQLHRRHDSHHLPSKITVIAYTYPFIHPIYISSRTIVKNPCNCASFRFARSLPTSPSVSLAVSSSRLAPSLFPTPIVPRGATIASVESVASVRCIYCIERSLPRAVAHSLEDDQAT